jgi:hypothetical protein
MNLRNARYVLISDSALLIYFKIILSIILDSVTNYRTN